VIRTDGGHHFGGDYGDLASTILTRWRAQIAKTGG
jgi:type IV secretory pathway VirJ component